MEHNGAPISLPELLFYRIVTQKIGDFFVGVLIPHLGNSLGRVLIASLSVLVKLQEFRPV